MKNKLSKCILLTFFFTFCVPFVLVALIAFSPDSFLTLPTNNWSTKWFSEFFLNNRWIEAFKQSFFTSSISTLLGLSIGISAAFTISRSNMRFKNISHWIILLPMLIPQIVLAMGSLPTFYFLEIHNSAIPLIIVHTVIILPIIYLILKTNLDKLNPELDNVAMGLGAGLFDTFYKITIPLLLPHIIASGIIAFTISINESIISIFLTNHGNETIPSMSWSQLKHAPSPIIAVASILNILIITLIAFLSFILKNLRRFKY